MTINSIAYATALARTPVNLQEPLTASSPIIVLWKKILENQFSKHCSAVNMRNLSTCKCLYVWPNIRYRLEEVGKLRVEVRPKIRNHCFMRPQVLSSDRRDLVNPRRETGNATCMLARGLAQEHPDFCCSVALFKLGQDKVQKEITLGPRQLLQLLYVMISLVQAFHVYYDKFFEGLSRRVPEDIAVNQRGLRCLIKILRNRDNPVLVAERIAFLETTSSILKELRDIYGEMKRLMGEERIYQAPSLLSLSLKCMFDSSYQPWRYSSSASQITSLYLKRTLRMRTLRKPSLKEELARLIGLGIAPPVGAGREEPAFCSQGRAGSNDEEELSLIPFCSLVLGYEKKFTQLVLKTVLPVGVGERLDMEDASLIGVHRLKSSGRIRLMR